jgi:tyrosyl-tRNA synthetase
MNSVITNLEQRGILHSVTDRVLLDKTFNDGAVTFYCGFDPTADSLHVGSLLPLIIMRRLANAGHNPIGLLGGGTGMIGDPSGRSEERNLLDEKQLQFNLNGIKPQVAKVVGSKCQLISNSDWLTKLSMIEFLRDVGKHFSVNAMLQRDSIKTRLETRDEGISYTEFSYMLLQAYDFLWLYEHKKCVLQIGGSDQWGNIVSGVDLIRRKFTGGAPSFGMTNHLLTTSSGAKFGKTAAGAVWLDAKKTSPYEFYQYWLNSEDADVEKYLKYFTEISVEEILSIVGEHSKAPEQRIAQKRLAQEMTTLVHGPEELKMVEGATSALFGGDLKTLDLKSLEDAFSSAPSSFIHKGQLSEGISIADLLVLAQASKSKGEARRLIEGGGCQLNSAKVESATKMITLADLMHDSVLVIRTGKKNYFIVRLLA